MIEIKTNVPESALKRLREGYGKRVSHSDLVRLPMIEKAKAVTKGKGKKDKLSQVKGV